MKLNEGMVAIGELFKRKAVEPEKKVRQLQPFQELALRIIEMLKIDKDNTGIIFKTCQRNKNSLAYIEHCLSETLELTARKQGQIDEKKRANYFIKLIKVKSK